MLIEAAQVLKFTATTLGTDDINQLAFLAKRPSFEAVDAKQQWTPTTPGPTFARAKAGKRSQTDSLCGGVGQREFQRCRARCCHAFGDMESKVCDGWNAAWPARIDIEKDGILR